MAKQRSAPNRIQENVEAKRQAGLAGADAAHAAIEALNTRNLELEEELETQVTALQNQLATERDKFANKLERLETEKANLEGQVARYQMIHSAVVREINSSSTK